MKKIRFELFRRRYALRFGRCEMQPPRAGGKSLTPEARKRIERIAPGGTCEIPKKSGGSAFYVRDSAKGKIGEAKKLMGAVGRAKKSMASVTTTEARKAKLREKLRELGRKLRDEAGGKPEPKDGSSSSAEEFDGTEYGREYRRTAIRPADFRADELSDDDLRGLSESLAEGGKRLGDLLLRDPRIRIVAEWLRAYTAEASAPLPGMDLPIDHGMIIRGEGGVSWSDFSPDPRKDRDLSPSKGEFLKVFSRMVALSPKSACYRGLSLKTLPKEGDVLRQSSPINSWTDDVSVAANFSEFNRAGALDFSVVLRGMVASVPLNSISVYGSEREWVGGGRSLVVESVSKSGDKYMVFVREEGPDDGWERSVRRKVSPAKSREEYIENRETVNLLKRKQDAEAHGEEYEKEVALLWPQDAEKLRRARLGPSMRQGGQALFYVRRLLSERRNPESAETLSRIGRGEVPFQKILRVFFSSYPEQVERTLKELENK